MDGLLLPATADASAGGPALVARIGAIGQRLLENLPDDTGGREQTLVERALRYAAEAEQRMAVQMERIAQLESISSTDALTGLLNRRGFEAHLAKAMARARRYGELGVVVYGDLDGFKDINDRFGHAAGDELLKAAARTLVRTVRETDIVGRLGGDEFALVLVNTSWKDAQKRARTLEWVLNASGVVFRGHDIPLQISLGIEPYGPDDVVEDVLNRADMAMYYAKRRKHLGRLPAAAE